MLKIPNNVLQFAQNNTDVYTAFSDYVNHYRAINEDKKVDFDKSVTFEEKSEKMNEALRKEIARIIEVNLPLMNKNKFMIQEVADGIIAYLIGAIKGEK